MKRSNEKADNIPSNEKVRCDGSETGYCTRVVPGQRAIGHGPVRLPPEGTVGVRVLVGIGLCGAIPQSRWWRACACRRPIASRAGPSPHNLNCFRITNNTSAAAARPLTDHLTRGWDGRVSAKLQSLTLCDVEEADGPFRTHSEDSIDRNTPNGSS
jgi:hypothetical protein